MVSALSVSCLIRGPHIREAMCTLIDTLQHLQAHHDKKRTLLREMYAWMSTPGSDATLKIINCVYANAHPVTSSLPLCFQSLPRITPAAFPGHAPDMTLNVSTCI